MADEAKLLAAAKAGEIETIFELAGSDGDDDDDDADDDDDDDDDDGGGSDDADMLVYKWLLVAADFGHEAANDAIEDMHETSSFRYDDDQAVAGLIHLELAEAYLRGESGLAVDLALAKEHLDEAKQLEVHVSTDVAKSFGAIRRKLDAAALAVFDEVFPPTKAKQSTAKSKKPQKKKRT